MTEHPDIAFVRKTAEKLSVEELERWMDSLANQIKTLEICKEMYRILEDVRRKKNDNP